MDMRRRCFEDEVDREPRHYHHIPTRADHFAMRALRALGHLGWARCSISGMLVDFRRRRHDADMETHFGSPGLLAVALSLETGEQMRLEDCE